MAEEKLFSVEALGGYPLAIARALHAMLYARSWTLRYLDGITDEILNRRPAGHQYSIGTLLYHIAVFEMDWLYSDIRGQGFPPQVQALIPHEPFGDDHRYTPVTGEFLDDHLDRLARVRSVFLDGLRDMTVEAFRRPLNHETYCTAEWVVHHLAQHESEHRGQIWEARIAAEAELSAWGVLPKDG